jgi:hypothetical protein
MHSFHPTDNHKQQFDFPAFSMNRRSHFVIVRLYLLLHPFLYFTINQRSVQFLDIATLTSLSPMLSLLVGLSSVAAIRIWPLGDSIAHRGCVRFSSLRLFSISQVH